MRLVTTGEGTVQMLYELTLELLKSTNPFKPRGMRQERQKDAGPKLSTSPMQGPILKHIPSLTSPSRSANTHPSSWEHQP